jgi:hypothetical protein
MNRCAYPGCPNQLVTIETGTIVGEVCHIRAQNIGGPRYLESQDDEERHSFENLILMCGNHHTEIDAAANLHKYTVEWLLKTKRAHEDEGRLSGELDAPASVITALIWGVSVYAPGSTHMDFRNATFKVGGEGGSMLGGGGSGGVLTIVGIASLPRAVERDMEIDLAGGNGQFPGSGGGGGGLLVYQGRAANADDVSAGLAVPLFFPVNAAQLAGGLLYILGAGWDHLTVSTIPGRVTINVAFTVEFGSIDANTLLSFELKVTDPSGTQCGSVTTDVAVPEPQGVVNRNSGAASVGFDVGSAGLHELSILSDGARFARYTFEIRLPS